MQAYQCEINCKSKKNNIMSDINYIKEWSMLIILSPAKKQKFDSKSYEIETSLPRFTAEANDLVKLLCNYTKEELKTLMHISTELAELNYDRYKTYRPSFDNKSTLSPAILAFQGDAYRSLEAHKFEKDDVNFCKENLAIISGLYGLLEPYDGIQPYRLEMKTKLKNDKGSTLYDFWEDKITLALQNKIKNHQDKIIVNLASDEYSKAINTSNHDIPILKIDFKEEKNNKLKTIGIHAKKARGAMAKYIIKNKIILRDNLKNFKMEGYTFSKDLSNRSEYVFVR